MSTIEIKHRTTGAVLWSGEATSVRGALKAAVAADANLAGAYLAGAYLAGADLAGANLAGADLAGADLAGADLAGADLAGAYLAGADLAGAYLAGADLAGAYLAGADLAGADLAGAYLAGADLAGADLARANLADANLARANLARANLADANLAGAYLARAYLADADLARANLADANLARADLADANLAGAYLARARNVPDLSSHVEPSEPYKRVGKTRQEHAAAYRERHPEVPVIPNLDQRILDAIARPGCALDMGAWHACETAHCRAGWAIHLAGEAGYALENKLGDSAAAGRAIYRASTGRAPHFYATNERALEDIRRCAAEDASTP
jgi:uncharacterized protein YjbI with pentapeptide repeats